MSFDQPTRNRLQRFVSDARTLLTEEFTRQLQKDFGMDPKSGEVTGLDRLGHLDDARLETARLLREILAHYLASDMAKGQKGQKAALDRILREQAFTVLNPLAALRMMEARGLLRESVGNGYQSTGFQLYERLAGHALGETGTAYRVYLESLFDEFAVDLKVLFDRYSPHGRLFPGETALLKLLDLINDPEIEALWGEDETIGWVYQYFNFKEERKAMRDASQAPRNSRELAVRNQFFTPRYVVEFLVDNTLGRMWFDVTSGQTSLHDRRQYLLVKPEDAVVSGQLSVVSDSKALTTAPTALRDPRTIKLLDPACGSMHFGLYAFDLFDVIYREAWAWEQEHGPGSLGGDDDNEPLAKTYATEGAFLLDVPRLIVERNIYGVEIDPRAAQIASLALWLRAQRAWNEAGVKALDRPPIGRSNVVAAVAPPTEKDLRERFASELDAADAELFERSLVMLKGLPELGVLLRIERELPDLIRAVYGEHGPIFRDQDAEQWRGAESRLREALVEFIHSAGSGYQGRLFATDALQGLRVIDLCRDLFDVVVMNPPFGEAAEHSRNYQKAGYPHSHQDIFQCFVERALEMTRDRGFVGVLSARTGFFMGDSESWRTEVVWRNQLALFADLGLGVLDDALVEAAAYVIQRGAGGDDKIVASRHLATREKESSLLASTQEISCLPVELKDVFVISQDIIERIPGGVFGYWAPVEFLERFKESESFGNNVSAVRQGLATADDFRFVRLAWEVSPESIGKDCRWSRFSKGGEYSPPYDDIHLLVDWADDGKQLRTLSSARVQNDKWYHKAGATYTVRTASAFAAKVLPAGCVFSHNAQSWFVDDSTLLLKSILYFLSRVPQAYIELAVGGGDIATSGSAARRYTTKVIHSIPASVVHRLSYLGFEEDSQHLFRLVAHDQTLDETTCLFSGFPLSDCNSFDELTRQLIALRQALVSKALRASWRIDNAVTAAWNLSSREVEFVRSEVGAHPCEYRSDAPAHAVRELLGLSVDELIRRGVEQDGAARWLTKKSYFVDRKTELICHILKCPPESIERGVGKSLSDCNEFAQKLVSYAVGAAFGRWTTADVDESAMERFVNSPLEELPNFQPAATRGVTGPSILVEERGHESSITAAVERALRAAWKENSVNVEREIVSALGVDLERYLKREFFANHLATYSKSRRKAPIYWPLATASGSYTLWVYYLSLTRSLEATKSLQMSQILRRQVWPRQTAARRPDRAGAWRWPEGDWVPSGSRRAVGIALGG